MFLKIAKIAQLVERHLAKVEVAGSNPVFRSGRSKKTEVAGSPDASGPFFAHIKYHARVVELVDTLDLKSNGHYGRTGSSPVPSTESLVNLLIFKAFNFYTLSFPTI